MKRFASLLAVVDAAGKVTAVAGATGLRDVNLGASPAVKNGFDHPTSDVWTLPDQVQVVGVAPIRSGDQTPALLVKGLPLGRSQLATVGTSLGVTGALFITAATAKKLKLGKKPIQIGSGTGQINGTGKLVLKLKTKYKAKLRKVKRFAATIGISATNAGGTTTKTRLVTLK